MEESKGLEKLTIHDLLKGTLGDKKADEILGKIQGYITQGLRGEVLKSHIYRALCDANVTDVGTYAICNVLIQVIARPQDDQVIIGGK